MRKRTVIVLLSVVALVAAIALFIRNRSKGVFGAFVPDVPEPPAGEGEAMEPISISSAQGAEAIEAQMRNIYNSQNERLLNASVNQLSDPYTDQLAQNVLLPFHLSQASVSTWRALPYKPSRLFPDVRASIDSLKGAKDQDFRGKPDAIKENWYRGLNDVFGFPFQPGNVWGEWVSQYWSNNDGNPSDDWNRYFGTVDKVLPNVGKNMDTVSNVLENLAINDLKKAGWKFIEV
jgi:hypothetical protein